MVVLMLVEVVAEFKIMRQYLAMRKLGGVPIFFSANDAHWFQEAA